MKHSCNRAAFHLLAIAAAAMMVSCGESDQAPSSGAKFDIPEPPARFTATERKTIRAESAQGLAKAQDEAEKMYPLSGPRGRTLPGNLDKNIEMSQRLAAEAEQKLLEKYGLEKMELLAIVMEDPY